MIRIILFSLLTLSLSCANMRAEANEETAEQPLPAAFPENVAVPADTPAAIPAVEPATETVRETISTRQAEVSSVQSEAAEPTASPEQAEAPAFAPAAVEGRNVDAIATETTTDEAAQSGNASTEIGENNAAETAPEESVLSARVQEIEAVDSASRFSARDEFSALKTVDANSPFRKKKGHFLPTKRRIDREIDKIKFAYKGEVMMGLTASYGTLSSDDTDFMLIIDKIDADGTMATVKPFIGYFYRDNNCLGVRFGYTHVGGTVNSAALDLGESNDVSFDVPYLDLKSDNYSFGIFHRSYAGLDPKGRFGLFAEFELAVSTGSSEFAYESGNVIKRSFSDNTQVKLSFNPGAAVYIFPNVCATLSFGLGGIQYTSVTQKDAEGNKIGSRKASNMKFRLNIAAINIGMTIHMWDKKKK